MAGFGPFLFLARPLHYVGYDLTKISISINMPSTAVAMFRNVNEATTKTREVSKKISQNISQNIIKSKKMNHN